eukprot:TRINITY_DN9484_c0_g1_i2.p1 TRINITY_DN9484_c0_g1~~TRINITY_DN9484_c0_g1_i2.p1  ORF type:complete len:768 (-),score=131.96 TRINITY_DN9484_c0_g1_i2:129-2381(-)
MDAPSSRRRRRSRSREQQMIFNVRDRARSMNLCVTSREKSLVPQLKERMLALKARDLTFEELHSELAKLREEFGHGSGRIRKASRSKREVVLPTDLPPAPPRAPEASQQLAVAHPVGTPAHGPGSLLRRGRRDRGGAVVELQPRTKHACPETGQQQTNRGIPAMGHVVEVPVTPPHRVRRCYASPRPVSSTTFAAGVRAQRRPLTAYLGLMHGGIQLVTREDPGAAGPHTVQREAFCTGTAARPTHPALMETTAMACEQKDNANQERAQGEFTQRQQHLERICQCQQAEAGQHSLAPATDVKAVQTECELASDNDGASFRDPASCASQDGKKQFKGGSLSQFQRALHFDSPEPFGHYASEVFARKDSSNCDATSAFFRHLESSECNWQDPSEVFSRPLAKSDVKVQEVEPARHAHSTRVEFQVWDHAPALACEPQQLVPVQHDAPRQAHPMRAECQARDHVRAFRQEPQLLVPIQDAAPRQAHSMRAECQVRDHVRALPQEPQQLVPMQDDAPRQAHSMRAERQVRDHVPALPQEPLQLAPMQDDAPRQAHSMRAERQVRDHVPALSQEPQQLVPAQHDAWWVNLAMEAGWKPPATEKPDEVKGVPTQVGMLDDAFCFEGSNLESLTGDMLGLSETAMPDEGNGGFVQGSRLADGMFGGLPKETPVEAKCEFEQVGLLDDAFCFEGNRLTDDWFGLPPVWGPDSSHASDLATDATPEHETGLFPLGCGLIDDLLKLGRKISSAPSEPSWS